MKPSELDAILQNAKTCSKSELRMYVARLAIEVRRLDDISARENEITRLSDAIDELEEAARAFTLPRYQGLIGGTNHVDQSRLIVALKVWESMKHAFSRARHSGHSAGA